MSFAYPIILLFPLLYLLVSLLKSGNKSKSLAFSDFSIFKQYQSWRQQWRKPTLYFLSFSAIVLFSIAAARPQNITPLPQPKAARNILLALDISGSMQTPDFSVGRGNATRLAAVKEVVKNFILERQDDRIGLVAFGTRAFLECPLTLDHQLVSNMVKNLQVGMAGEGTAIGDGLGLALKRIKDVPSSSSTVILLTDGVNTSGSIDPNQAAQIAKNLKIKVHTVGIGSSSTLSRARSNPLQNGNLKVYEFDEKLLKNIAEQTGGYYFNASDLEGLKEVYAQISQLETSDVEALHNYRIDELFLPYLSWALIFYLLFLLLNYSIFEVIP